jgi:hypothetical protein
MQAMMEKFKQWCGLPLVQGAIDGTHISISKPIHFPEDYFYHKIRWVFHSSHVVVDCKKRFKFFL